MLGKLSEKLDQLEKNLELKFGNNNNTFIIIFNIDIFLVFVLICF